MLAPSVGVLFWTGITFFVALLLLYKFAWKPLLNSLDRQQGSGKQDTAEGVKLHRPPSTERCPFRHDTLDVHGVVCTSCLARHHTECWDDHEECAGCGNSERYSGTERSAGRSPPRVTDRKSS